MGLVAQLADSIEKKLGLYFAQERWEDLERGILAATRESGYPTAEEFVRTAILSAPLSKEMTALARNLTIGETYFFRDEAFFRLLEESVLPVLIARRRAAGMPFLRIWSAACCTGEEPYSIAMLLTKLLPDLNQWTVTILGTDLNTTFLEKAREGKYGDWSMRALAPGLKALYFESAKDKRHLVKNEIRRMVHFAQLNLTLEEYPSPLTNTQAMDLVLCRNVLMYMTVGKAESILARLGKALSEDGLLALAPVETTLARVSGLIASPYGVPFLLAKTGDPKPPESGNFPSAAAGRSLRPTAVSDATAVHSIAGKSTGMEREKSEEILAQARLEKDPWDYPAMAILTKAYADQGRLEDALQWGLKAAEGIASSELSFLVATIFREKGDDGEAISRLTELLKKDQDFILAHFALGSLQQRLEGPQSALSHFRNALRLVQALPSNYALPGSDGEMTSGKLKLVLLNILNKDDAQ